MRFTKTIIPCLAAAMLAACAHVRPTVPGVAGSAANAPLTNAALSSETVKISAQNGLDWLLSHQTQQDKILMDGLIAMHNINLTYCHRPEIDDYTRKMAVELPPGADSFRRLIDGSTMYAYPEDVLHRRVNGRYDPNSLFIMAMYCDIHPLPENAADQILDVTPSTSSNIFHSFIQMTFLNALGCKSREKDEHFRTIFRKAAEQLASKRDLRENIGDHERYVVALETAGYPELVKEEWVRNIISRQLVSGAWPRLGAYDPNPDATALAVLALTLHLKECPLPAGHGENR